MTKMTLTHQAVSVLAQLAANDIANLCPHGRAIYAIPRGGIPAAMAIVAHYPEMYLVDDPDLADVFVDDIIDSGATRQAWAVSNPGIPFVALIDKTDKQAELYGCWIVFPWEGDSATSIEGNIARLLQYVGENPKRGGLIETPRRVAKAWEHWCSGYGKNAAEILKVFEDGAENYDEMVVVKDIPIYSKCEHHLADIFGTVTIAYIPNGKIVGLSKLARLADMYARRLQVQERLTSQIADALQEHLNPKGVGVIIRARHLCMESRGICQQGHHTITSALRGVLKDVPEARAEFMDLAK